MMSIQRHTGILLAACALLCAPRAAAQHTLGLIAGYGSGTARFQPKQEMRAQWGLWNGGLTWRYYGAQRYVGGFGVDLELLQQAFSFATNSAQVEEKSDYLYYTRRLHSVVVPVVWQPHIYLARNRLRVYLEAAATFSYNFASTYTQQSWADREAGVRETHGGTYRFKVPRDNRWGYGLAGGGGFAVLVGRFELNFRARYYFGYSDLVRNRNRYYDNGDDGPENPFYATPLRSPLDRFSLSVGLNYRFRREGFEAWKPRPKRTKNREVFRFGL